MKSIIIFHDQFKLTNKALEFINRIKGTDTYRVILVSKDDLSPGTSPSRKQLWLLLDQLTHGSREKVLIMQKTSFCADLIIKYIDEYEVQYLVAGSTSEQFSVLGIVPFDIIDRRNVPFILIPANVVDISLQEVVLVSDLASFKQLHFPPVIITMVSKLKMKVKYTLLQHSQRSINNACQEISLSDHFQQEKVSISSKIYTIGANQLTKLKPSCVPDLISFCYRQSTYPRKEMIKLSTILQRPVMLLGN